MRHLRIPPVRVRSNPALLWHEAGNGPFIPSHDVPVGDPQLKAYAYATISNPDINEKVWGKREQDGFDVMGHVYQEYFDEPLLIHPHAFDSKFSDVDPHFDRESSHRVHTFYFKLAHNVPTMDEAKKRAEAFIRRLDAFLAPR